MLEKVKDYLKITWDDEDSQLNSLVDRGKKYLEGLTGVILGFEDDSLEQGLLLDYCRYAYNNATEYFQENYSSDILRLQLFCGVDQLNESEEGG